MKVQQNSARDLAVLALRDREGNVSAHLARLLEREPLRPVDRALAEELALGVVRRRATLQQVLRAFLVQSDRRLPGALNEILLVAAYQLLLLDRVPDFAAVNEAVEQAGRFHHRRQSGLVNGVLRSIARSLSPLQEGCGPLAVDVVPVNAVAHRKLDRPVFADPARDAEHYLAAAFSLPPALARRWLAREGGLEAAAELARHADTRAPLILRVNRLRSDVAGVLTALAQAGVEAYAHDNGFSVVPARHANVTELEVFRDGRVQPQDATATAVGLAAAPQKGWRVLDFCAAPGTKTTHLAELMNNEGQIVAVDVSAEKLARVDDNCRRLGASIVQTLEAAKIGSLTPQTFDLVLLDAPCSNTGVLARRAEARWNFSDDSLATLARDQRFLAAAAANFVRPGGRLVYSTCSIEAEETALIARHVTRTFPHLKLLSETLTLPGGADRPTGWHDGGYTAVFEAK